MSEMKFQLVPRRKWTIWLKFLILISAIFSFHMLLFRYSFDLAVEEGQVVTSPNSPNNPDTFEQRPSVPQRQVATIKSHQERKPTVAFITYELFPVTTWGGGAGVVINALIKDLLEAGHDVIVLADFGRDYLTEWENYRRNSLKSGNLGKLYVRHVATVIKSVEIAHSNSIFMVKSRSFAMALKLVYEEIPFDIVECFDYAGVSYELLRKKAELNGILEDYLPDHVLVSIRFHGTLQLIDRAEKSEVSLDTATERSMMYIQEHFGVYSADLLFCQTKFMITKLANEYDATEGEIFYAPAPLESILQTVDEADAMLPKMSGKPWERSFDFFVYGRFQLVKGLETIVLAAVSMLRTNTHGVFNNEKYPIRFVFVGPDQYSTEHASLSSVYLQSFIPQDLKSHFQFYPQPINRTTLVNYSRNIRAAIFASQFETLNLAVHELARLHVPLILSKIPAFEEYFSDSKQVVFFETGNVESLKGAIKAVVEDKFNEIIKQVRDGEFRLKYADATEVYRFYELPDIRRRLRPEAFEMDKKIKIMDAKISN